MERQRAPTHGSRTDAPQIAGLHVRIAVGPLSPERLRQAVADPAAGAIVCFEGVTREVQRLDYEVYAEMASERIELIARECAARHELCAIAVEHRSGSVPLGEPSVIVAVSAPHRAAAFAAAREAIDRIKDEAPIWKRELHADGTARWVDGPAPPGPSTHPDGQAPADPLAYLDERAPTDPLVHFDGQAPTLDGQAPTGPLTHLGADGAARMIDVGAKPESERVARARARVRMSSRCARAVQAGDGPKGEVLGVARIAGIQAAKQAAQLIPLAHPLPLMFVDVEADVQVEAGIVELTAEARTHARTGVEMEAMTACAVAALTVYDMVKGIERGVEIEQVVLLHKRGGRSDYTRPPGDHVHPGPED